jgi:hypothetical protein
VQLPAQGEYVVEFIGIDAAGGIAGDVADVVRAGSARNDACLVEVGEKRGHVLAGDFPDLQVGPGGDVHVAAAVGFRGVRDGLRLVGAQDAAGNSQAAHHGLLGRRNVPQAMGLEAEEVLAFRKLALGGEFRDAGPGIQGIRLELDFLFLGQALAGGEPGELGALARRKRGFAFRGGGRRLRGHRGLTAQRAKETVEVFFLRGGEGKSVRRYQLCYSRRFRVAGPVLCHSLFLLSPGGIRNGQRFGRTGDSWQIYRRTNAKGVPARFGREFGPCL